MKVGETTSQFKRARGKYDAAFPRRLEESGRLFTGQHEWEFVWFDQSRFIRHWQMLFIFSYLNKKRKNIYAFDTFHTHQRNKMLNMDTNRWFYTALHYWPAVISSDENGNDILAETWVTENRHRKRCTRKSIWYLFPNDKNIHVPQPSPQAFSARSNLDAAVSRDVTERDLPTSSQTRADNGVRENA